jgi:hypothetical protein
MAFYVRCNFDHIDSYALAVRAWKKGVVLRKNPEGPRGLVNKRKRMTVEMTAAEDVILRLFEHPVVTWHRDGSVTISGFNSISTTVFTTHCTPDEMSAHLRGGRFAIYIKNKGSGWRIYQVGNTITFRERDGTWEADEITTPWKIRTINRERAKQAREESGYNDFRAWLIIYVQLAEAPRNRNHIRDKLALLSDRSKWRELARCYPEAWRDVEYALESLRETIYNQRGCLDDKSVPFLG